MRPEALGGFLDSLPGPMPSINYDEYLAGPLRSLLAGQMSEAEGGVVLLTRVKMNHAESFPALSAQVRAALPGAIAFNGSSFVLHIVELIYREMERLGAITFVVILIVLLAVFRRPRLVMAILLPLFASLLWTFGAMGWLDIRLNMMNSAVAVFIFGLIVDYSIFLTLAMQGCGSERDEHLLRTCGAITVSALTTLCGMGALLFAGHPALHTIGATAFLGIGSGLVAVFTVIPLLNSSPRGSQGREADIT
jgi:predicted RND superfamily exporter protein